MYSFKEVSKHEYDGTPGCYTVLEHRRANQYWLLLIQDKAYGFSVDASIMIPPIVVDFVDDNILCIGVDDFIVLFSTLNGRIGFLSGLTEPITEVVKIDLNYLVVTDTTVVTINRYFLAVGKVITFPDIINDYQISNGKLTVQGICGETFEVPYP
ncbi:hypothetical protein [Mucilaginibacter agri]|uniref:Uncharacterized protein n=1 Tax=Mucilaginibacter agri TaxID=2695265 RepID=A0A965ZGN4_9SPHI|nr:hypothetical protein [Mucilaginibacter agri]NCD70650.1 hypothetical protein [Mucilaginibacter agri]